MKLQIVYFPLKYDNYPIEQQFMKLCEPDWFWLWPFEPQNCSQRDFVNTVSTKTQAFLKFGSTCSILEFWRFFFVMWLVMFIRYENIYTSWCCVEKNIWEEKGRVGKEEEKGRRKRRIKSGNEKKGKGKTRKEGRG